MDNLACFLLENVAAALLYGTIEGAARVRGRSGSATKALLVAGRFVCLIWSDHQVSGCRNLLGLETCTTYTESRLTQPGAFHVSYNEYLLDSDHTIECGCSRFLAGGWPKTWGTREVRGQ